MTTLALSTIVRDAALCLPACLESVHGMVDEIVIADTGSTDETVQIAMGFGARVIPVGWTDDFAAARNKALAAVKSDWVLALDADEQLDPSAAAHIRSMIADASTTAYQVTIRNYVVSLEDRIWDRASKPNDSEFPAARKYPAYVEHENVRLFRRAPEIYFVGRVRECWPAGTGDTRQVGPCTFLDPPLWAGRRCGNASAEEPFLSTAGAGEAARDAAERASAS